MRSRLTTFLLFLSCLTWAPNALSQTVTFSGRVTNVAGQGLCAMVLINGQYAFSCDGNGSYQVTFPLNAQGQATVFSFVDGMAPFRQIVQPHTTNQTFNVSMRPSTGTPAPSVTRTATTILANNQVQIAGHVRNAAGVPLCAMVLANGQYMFSCDGAGNFSLTVPRAPDGSITLFSFVDGMSPYRSTFQPNIAQQPGPVGVAKLYGLVTFNYKFNHSPTVFTDTARFSSANRANDGNLYAYVQGTGRPIACGPVESAQFEFLCIIVFPNGSLDAMAFNISISGGISGIYHYCPATYTVGQCGLELVTTPFGTVTGLVNRAASGMTLENRSMGTEEAEKSSEWEIAQSAIGSKGAAPEELDEATLRLIEQIVDALVRMR